MKQIKKYLEGDDEYAAFKRILKNCQAVDVEAFVKEIQNLHAGRQVRALKGKNSSSVRRLTDACSEDQSYRSRLVEIKIVCGKEFNMLRMAHDAIRDHLNSKYSSKLGLRSQGERDAVWRTVLKRSHSRLAELDDTIDFADLVIEDIDKASYAIKHMLDALNIVQKGFEH